MNGLFNEMTYFNGVRRDRPGHPQALRRARRPDDVQPLRRRLGGRRRHAVHLDEAGGVELRRHPQRHGDSLAEGDRGKGRGALAVAPRHRHRADDPRGRGPAGAEERQRHAADADRRRQHGSTPSPTPRLRARTLPSTSRSSATAPSTMTAGSPAPSTGRPGNSSRAARSKTISGNCTTHGRTSAWRTIWRRRIPRS